MPKLRKRMEDSLEGILEMVVGKSKADRNAKFTRDLFALTDSER